MKRFRHPIRAIREPFGTAGLIVAFVALVAALGGTALAAKGALTGKQKKEVEKIAKKFAKAGPQGPAGPAGPGGAAGAKGDKGDAGANGTNGTNGTSGANGVSPVGTSFTGAKGGCTEGGVEFKGANTTFACNGENGETGFTETLPPGKTETGVFVGSGAQSFVTMSFNIPLPHGDVPALNIIKEDETAAKGSTANCPGDALKPKANPGQLCLYVTHEGEATLASTFPYVESEQGYGVSMGFASTTGYAVGTWAVTAST
jgi:hypothetical protein